MPVRQPNRRVTHEQADAIRARVAQRNLSLVDIAKEFHTTPRTVKRIINNEIHYGIDHRGKNNPNSNHQYDASLERDMAFHSIKDAEGAIITPSSQMPGIRIYEEIFTTYVSGLTRNALGVTDDDKERIAYIISTVRFYAALFRIPMWKMIDLLLSRGLVNWFQENEHIIKAAIMRDTSMLNAAIAMYEQNNKDKEEHDSNYWSFINRMNKIMQDNVKAEL